jgi:hypothetical protein
VLQRLRLVFMRGVDRAPWPPAPYFDVVSVALGIRKNCWFSINLRNRGQPDNWPHLGSLSGADARP